MARPHRSAPSPILSAIREKERKGLLFANDVRDILALAVRLVGNQTKVAAEIGCSQTHVSEVLTRRREPGPKILRAFGLRRITLYEPISK